jgi:hypothetical protein
VPRIHRAYFLLSIGLLGCTRAAGSDVAEATQAPQVTSSNQQPVPSSTPPAGVTAPFIALDGTMTRLEPKPASEGTRIHARALRTWIYDAPKAQATRIGAIRAGMALDASKSSAGHEGCQGGWHAVVPLGFVCVGDEATLDGNDSLVRALADFPADLTKPLPFIYGTVRRPGPIYLRLPTPEELERIEPDLQKRMAAWLNAPGEIGASYGQHLWVGDKTPAADPRQAWESQQSDEPPWFLARGSPAPLLAGRATPSDPLLLGRMEPRVGYSILKTFLSHGRRYGVTTDLALVPTDRLRPIQGSSFHGFRIPEDIDFPFAIIRSPGARQYQFDREKNRLAPAEVAEYRTALRLTGKQNFFHGRLYYETTSERWLSDNDASRLDPARRMPAWGKNGEKWIDVNITKQTLVLFEGTKPVYATLVSTGEAGLQDAEHSTATQRGIFRIHTKFVSATMDSDEVGEEFELRDVPYVQYFEKGYALHGAYWHDRFGIPKSHGCINLAPEDARRIFFWTEPALPNGWYAVLKPLRGTVLFVHP